MRQLRRSLRILSEMKKYDTLFLDRDGVLNKKIEAGYVLDICDIEVLPGVVHFLSRVRNLFNQIIVVTNQRCVGRGMLTMDRLEMINRTLNQLTGSHIDHFLVCPHLNNDMCECRKPKDGLFRKAGDIYNIDFSNSVLVGDSESDLIPAKELGIKTIYISGYESKYADKRVSSTLHLLSAFNNLY